MLAGEASSFSPAIKMARGGNCYVLGGFVQVRSPPVDAKATPAGNEPEESVEIERPKLINWCVGLLIAAGPLLDLLWPFIDKPGIRSGSRADNGSPRRFQTTG